MLVLQLPLVLWWAVAAWRARNEDLQWLTTSMAAFWDETLVVTVLADSGMIQVVTLF